jgi:hypothetical protein
MEAFSPEIATESRTHHVTPKKSRKEIARALIEFETITTQLSERIAAESLGLDKVNPSCALKVDFFHPCL